MDLLTVVTAVGFLLLVTGVTGRSYSATTAFSGIVVIAVCILLRLFSGAGFFGVTTELFRDAGIALVLSAGWLTLRKADRGVRSFFMLGLMSLALWGVLFLVQVVVGSFKGNHNASILVELGPDDTVDEVESILDSYGASAEEAFPSVSFEMDVDLSQTYLVDVDEDDIDELTAALRADGENVDFVEKNGEVSLWPPVSGETVPVLSSSDYLENDPMVNEQWALEAIGVHPVHRMLHDVEPTYTARVAIIDTGVDHDHEDLQVVAGATEEKGMFRRLLDRTVVWILDWLRSKFDAESISGDVHGHGTHCAGIAGAVTNNGRGVASLNWEGRFIEILSFKGLGDNGMGTTEQIAQAIIDASQADADVLSMSLGAPVSSPPRTWVKAIEFALRNGAIVAAAAGNSNRDAARHAPSNIDGVIAVAAVDQAFEKAKFSNTVGTLSRPIAAPGVDILSLTPNNGYSPKSGTSMATPVVTGLLGLMRSLNPKLSAEDAYQILYETGTEVAATPQVGRVVNAEAAVKAVRTHYSQTSALSSQTTVE